MTLTAIAEDQIEARVRTAAQTGVEMEALHTVAVACLTSCVNQRSKMGERGSSNADCRLASPTASAAVEI